LFWYSQSYPVPFSHIAQLLNLAVPGANGTASVLAKLWSECILVPLIADLSRDDYSTDAAQQITREGRGRFSRCLNAGLRRTSYTLFESGSCSSPTDS